MNKSSNIIRWTVFGVLLVITLVLTVLFYANIKNDTYTDWLLNWGYILIGLGVIIAAISALVAIIVAILRGIPLNKVISLCIVAVVLVVLAIIAFVVSPDMIDTGLNFFYLTFGFSILAIVFSVIYKAVKK